MACLLAAPLEEDRNNCNNPSDSANSDMISRRVNGQHPTITSSSMTGRRSTGHVFDNFRFTAAAIDCRKWMMNNENWRYVDENMTRHVRNCGRAKSADEEQSGIDDNNDYVIGSLNRAVSSQNVDSIFIYDQRYVDTARTRAAYVHHPPPRCDDVRQRLKRTSKRWTSSAALFARVGVHRHRVDNQRATDRDLISLDNKRKEQQLMDIDNDHEQAAAAYLVYHNPTVNNTNHELYHQRQRLHSYDQPMTSSNDLRTSSARRQPTRAAAVSSFTRPFPVTTTFSTVENATYDGNYSAPGNSGGKVAAVSLLTDKSRSVCEKNNNAALTRTDTNVASSHRDQPYCDALLAVSRLESTFRQNDVGSLASNVIPPEGGSTRFHTAPAATCHVMPQLSSRVVSCIYC